MKKIYPWGLFSLTIIFLLFWALPANAQIQNGLYFQETGHWLTGEFLNYYSSWDSPSYLFGLPITDAFFDPKTNHLVQYFQKALFYQVILENNEKIVMRVPLGEKLYKPGLALQCPGGFPPCKKFPNGFEVCYAFRDFYLANGGEAFFGYPVSNFELHHGLIVQYFQFARFEWHPENPPGLQVTLSDLGREYFDHIKEDQNLLKGDHTNALPGFAEEIRVKAFAERIRLTRKDEQKIYVIVTDKNLRPLANAIVNIKVLFPDGRNNFYLLKPTNEKGITSAAFSSQTSTPGLIIVQVSATYNQQTIDTETFYRHWW